MATVHRGRYTSLRGDHLADKTETPSVNTADKCMLHRDTGMSRRAAGLMLSNELTNGRLKVPEVVAEELLTPLLRQPAGPALPTTPHGDVREAAAASSTEQQEVGCPCCTELQNELKHAWTPRRHFWRCCPYPPPCL